MPSKRLGSSLARFDAEVAARGLPAAAGALLAGFGARIVRVGPPLPPGPALVITNHPGAYDALALMAALGREDVGLVAADRAFLRAMPSLAQHLVFASDTSAFGRLAGLRAARAWLSAGKTLVHFGAGRIEPDVCFDGGAPLAATWPQGTGVLAKHAAAVGAAVIPAFTSGVHSPRAKRLPFVRWAEARGITTLAPLVQATTPGFGDVVVRVALGERVENLGSLSHAECTYILRTRCAALAR